MDEELKQQIQDMIAETVKSSLKDALSPFARSQQDQISQIKDEVSQAVAESSNKWLDTLIEEADQYEFENTDDDDDDEPDDDDDDDDEPDDDEPDDARYQQYVKRRVQPYERRTSELEGTVSQLKKILDDERRGRIEAETRQKKETMTNAALDSIQKTGKVRNPKQLLTLLQTDGIVFESKDGHLVAKGKDEYGMDTTVALPSAIENLLNSDDYAHFGVSRPGTGTGAIPSGNGVSTMSGGKWFGNGDKMPDAKDMLDPRNLQEMLKEVDSANKR